MITTKTTGKNMVAGIITAAGASLCCITPLLALLGGAASVASSFSWIEPLRLCLVGATVLVFAFAWYQKLKPQKQVDCNCHQDNKASFLQSTTFLSVVTMVAALLFLFPRRDNADGCLHVFL